MLATSVSGMRGPDGVSMSTLLMAVRLWRSASRSLTATPNRRSPSHSCVATFPPSAVSMTSSTSATFRPYRAARLRSTSICSCGTSPPRSMNARETPRMPETIRSTAAACSRNVVGSSPKILMTICPSICEMLSSTLSRIGCEIAGSTPGRRPNACSICSARSSRVRCARHWDGGFRSTKNSAMLIVFGSVPSSGRPACEMTCVTSGNCRMICRTRAESRDASETETLDGNIRFTHSVPSFSSGRNSVPSCGTSASATASAATALTMTSRGRRSERSSVRR